MVGGARFGRRDPAALAQPCLTLQRCSVAQMKDAPVGRKVVRMRRNSAGSIIFHLPNGVEITQQRGGVIKQAFIGDVDVLVNHKVAGLRAMWTALASVLSPVHLQAGSSVSGRAKVPLPHPIQ